MTIGGPNSEPVALSSDAPAVTTAAIITPDAGKVQPVGVIALPARPASEAIAFVGRRKKVSAMAMSSKQRKRASLTAHFCLEELATED
jgi:hypothetical protein